MKTVYYIKGDLNEIDIEGSSIPKEVMKASTVALTDVIVAKLVRDEEGSIIGVLFAQ